MRFFNRILGFGALLTGLGGIVGDTNAQQPSGCLDIEYHVGTRQSDVEICNLLSGSDLYQSGIDLPFINPQSGRPGIFSDFSQYDPNNSKLSKDVRNPTTLNNKYDIKTVFSGTNNSTTSYLNFNFLSTETTDTFGGKVINLRQVDDSGNPINNCFYNVRSIINHTLGNDTLNPSQGIFNLPDLPIGNYNVNVPIAHYSVSIENPYLKVDLQKNIGTRENPNWVSANANTPAGVGPVKVIYASDAKAERNSVTDTYDKAVGWTKLYSSTGNQATSLGEFGLYTRGAAFGFNGTTSTNDRMKEEGRPVDDKGNILIEGYRNSSTAQPYVFAENEQLKLVFSTNDPEYFKTFNIIQREPYDFGNDSRYDSANNSHNTLENIIDSTTGIGELAFTAQGCPMTFFGPGCELDAIIGQTFAFDIFPQGGSAYTYSGDTFYLDGGYHVYHTTTPEPSTLALLAIGAGVVAASCKKLGIERKKAA